MILFSTNGLNLYKKKKREALISRCINLKYKTPTHAKQIKTQQNRTALHL